MEPIYILYPVYVIVVVYYQYELVQLQAPQEPRETLRVRFSTTNAHARQVSIVRNSRPVNRREP